MDVDDFDIESSHLTAEQREALVEAMGKGIIVDQFVQLVMLDDDPDGPSFVAEVTKQYMEDAAEHTTKLRTLATEDDPQWKKIDATAHQFKGSSSNMGADKVTKALVELRQATIKESKELCLALVDKVQAAYDEVEPYLKKFEGDGGDGDEASADAPAPKTDGADGDTKE
uniref:Histidine-containing phosphotransfer protein n=1 Tax=Prasinoderma coloniale TaxID=156133 RepID=A0A7R9TM41_9VIRI|mmetsp:Transcript_2687/g.10743  ORF Transcript_2687/g.10743 Transcript_2687/m.10743 type:complete len:170 (+) Transcript_2687:336-845(+)|eukprot:PRCOL_00006981-RA